MTMSRRAVLAGGVGLVLLPGRIRMASAQAVTPVREITPIAGSVYRFRNNFHYSVFAVTADGIVATDPINADAARWLKAELARRFSQPVRYLVYSHDHADHISGGEVFADTARIVAHENARRTIIAERRPTAVPQLTFSDRLALELGGTVVELVHVGRNHSDNSLVVRFPAERVLFAVDFIPVRSVGFRDWPDAYIEDWIESLRRVEAMDFDTLAPGHGPLGARDDVRAFRDYMEELRATVLRLAREGKSLDEVVQAVQMPKYESWAGYKDMFPLNVAGMYRHVQAHRRPN